MSSEHDAAACACTQGEAGRHLLHLTASFAVLPCRERSSPECPCSGHGVPCDSAVMHLHQYDLLSSCSPHAHHSPLSCTQNASPRHLATATSKKLSTSPHPTQHDPLIRSAFAHWRPASGSRNSERAHPHRAAGERGCARAARQAHRRPCRRRRSRRRRRGPRRGPQRWPPGAAGPPAHPPAPAHTHVRKTNVQLSVEFCLLRPSSGMGAAMSRPSCSMKCAAHMLRVAKAFRESQSMTNKAMRNDAMPLATQEGERVTPTWPKQADVSSSPGHLAAY